MWRWCFFSGFGIATHPSAIRMVKSPISTGECLFHSVSTKRSQAPLRMLMIDKAASRDGCVTSIATTFGIWFAQKRPHEQTKAASAQRPFFGGTCLPVKCLLRCLRCLVVVEGLRIRGNASVSVDHGAAVRSSDPNRPQRSAWTRHPATK